MRNGKIARLPQQVREQLNQRLEDGESSETLLPWLNSLPKTQTILAQYFGGHPILKQNLSEWRQGGFREWQTHCQAANLLHEIQDDHGPAHQSLAKLSTAKLARWLSIQYAATAYRLSSLADDPQAQWKRLRELCVDISRLRRADLLYERLRLDRKWLALETANSEAAKEKQFKKWLKRPDIRKALVPKPRVPSLAVIARACGNEGLADLLERLRGEANDSPKPAAPAQPSPSSTRASCRTQSIRSNPSTQAPISPATQSAKSAPSTQLPITPTPQPTQPPQSAQSNPPTQLSTESAKSDHVKPSQARSTLKFTLPHLENAKNSEDGYAQADSCCSSSSSSPSSSSSTSSPAPAAPRPSSPGVLKSLEREGQSAIPCVHVHPT